MRIDEALRIYLSEFRLPGEAPLISALLEHFAAHWRVRNSINFDILSKLFYFSRNVIISHLQIMMPLLV
jgi:brefeldin A-resistance guanine nucleotide exchange factor 1